MTMLTDNNTELFFWLGRDADEYEELAPEEFQARIDREKKVNEYLKEIYEKRREAETP